MLTSPHLIHPIPSLPGEHEGGWNVDEDVGRHHGEPHQQLVVAGLGAAAGVQLHPAAVDSCSCPAHQPAVVGGEGRVVQAPVLQVVISRVVVPVLQQPALELSTVLLEVSQCPEKHHEE